jgi:hypothetical protein
MHLNTLQAANAGGAGIPHLNRGTEPEDTPAAAQATDITSAWKAAAFSDAIMRLEAATKKNASSAAEPFVDGVAAGKITEGQSEPDFLQDLQPDLKQGPRRNALQDALNSIPTPATATAIIVPIVSGVVITTNAPTPSLTGAGNAGMSMRNASDSTITSLSRNPSPSFANMPADAGSLGVSVFSTGIPQINTTGTQTQLSADAQTLLGEFENSINHFEKTGNSWVGSARITFQSSVLKGASVQITSDGKSLNILLTQLAPTPLAHSLLRQEQQLSDALTRKLGRSVTVRVSGDSNESGDSDIQAADDVESQ